MASKIDNQEVGVATEPDLIMVPASIFPARMKPDVMEFLEAKLADLTEEERVEIERRSALIPSGFVVELNLPDDAGVLKFNATSLDAIAEVTRLINKAG